MDKDIPGCYDPIYQAERLALEQDGSAKIVHCSLCRCTLYSGDKFHEHRGVTVCSFCMDELIENADFVE